MLTSALQRTGKALFQECLYRSAALFGTYSRKHRRERAYILAYHSVCPADDPYRPYIGVNLTVPPAAFARQLAFLVRHYHVVSLSRLARHLETGYDGDRPLLAITFDDGYRDNYRYAFPILRQYDAEATFYLTTDCIDSDRPLWPLAAAYILHHTKQATLVLDGDPLDLRAPQGRRAALRALKQHLTGMPREQRESTLAQLGREARVDGVQQLCHAMLRWEEVKQMQHAGMEFGSHTCSHPSLPYIPFSEARDEIVLSKQAIENALDQPADHFCYPNPGDQPNFNEDLSALLKANGFRTSVTSQSGYARFGGSLFEMKRKGIYNPHSDLAVFHFHLENEAIYDRWRSVWPSARFSKPLGDDHAA